MRLQQWKMLKATRRSKELQASESMVNIITILLETLADYTVAGTYGDVLDVVEGALCWMAIKSQLSM